MYIWKCFIWFVCSCSFFVHVDVQFPMSWFTFGLKALFTRSVLLNQQCESRYRRYKHDAIFLFDSCFHFSIETWEHTFSTCFDMFEVKNYWLQQIMRGLDLMRFLQSLTCVNFDGHTMNTCCHVIRLFCINLQILILVKWRNIQRTYSFFYCFRWKNVQSGDEVR